MSENPTGLNETMNGLELLAENLTGYRELLCVLEATIELNGWFTNVGDTYENHQRFKEIEEKIIPEITTEPVNVNEVTTWELANEIQMRHGHMSVHAAEAAAEYWMDQ